MNRTLVWQLAWRYMRGKRGANIVPILSRISMVAIAVSSGAMIVLFSVFNGFEFLVRDLYKAFYPDIKITPASGKFFAPGGDTLQRIADMQGVVGFTNVIEDNVLVNANGEQHVVALKGIDRSYMAVNNIKPYIVDGVDSLTLGPRPTAILGMQVLNKLGLDVRNVYSQLELYYPDAKSDAILQGSQGALQTLVLKPDGAFQIQEEFDNKYVLAPLPLVQGLLQEEGHFSSIELKLADGANATDMQDELRTLLGTAYRIETRFEQNRTLYMVMRTEKWAVYAILLLVLLIASFNMVGALSLLVLEKQKDIAIIKAMGGTRGTIRSIFTTEGILWSLTGGGIGLLLGTLICLGQQHFQWIKLQGSFIIAAYPVHLKWQDYVLILVTVFVVGVLAAWYPAARAARIHMPSLKSD